MNTPSTPQTQANTRGKRQAKIKRSSESFRPGQAISNVVGKSKLLVVKVPTRSSIADSNNEYGRVSELAGRMDRQFNPSGQTPLGRLNRLQWEHSAWGMEFVINCDSNEPSALDQALSGSFRALGDVLTNEILAQGLSTGRPAEWEFKVGETLLDSGKFA